MSDLFGSSDEEDAGNPTPVEATNGLADPTPEDPPATNGLNGHEDSEEEDKAEDYTERGPRDDIKVSVLRFRKTADDFQFDVEVCVAAGQGEVGGACFSLRCYCSHLLLCDYTGGGE